MPTVVPRYAFAGRTRRLANDPLLVMRVGRHDQWLVSILTAGKTANTRVINLTAGKDRAADRISCVKTYRIPRKGYMIPMANVGSIPAGVTKEIGSEGSPGMAAFVLWGKV